MLLKDSWQHLVSLGKYVVSIFCMVCRMAERKYSCVLFTAKCLFMQGIFVHLSILFKPRARLCKVRWWWVSWSRDVRMLWMLEHIHSFTHALGLWGPWPVFLVNTYCVNWMWLSRYPPARLWSIFSHNWIWISCLRAQRTAHSSGGWLLWRDIFGKFSFLTREMIRLMRLSDLCVKYEVPVDGQLSLA